MLKKYQSYLYTVFLKKFFIISFVFFCLIIIINFFEEVRFSEKTNIDIYYSILLCVALPKSVESPKVAMVIESI